MKAQTLKGFRDFLPEQAKKRQYVINTLKGVFESFGFEPLETPALEYEEVLLGKYGEEGDKLMYRFEDNGQRRVALRYDQTVPLARVIAEKGNELAMPFKRYQIQPVWRAENTQKGRFREFLQCDADIVGVDSPLADAEIISIAIKSLQILGFKKFKVLINDRNVFSKLKQEGFVTDANLISVIRIIDKIKKIGEDGVINELQQRGFSSQTSNAILTNAKTLEQNPRIKDITKNLELMGISDNNYIFDPMLARGLDYYTGLIIELEIDGYTAGSVLGGGRYDKLIGMFSGKDIPAVGFAFGFDRLMEALEEFNLFPKTMNQTQALVTIFSRELKNKSVEVTAYLRSKNINTELYLDETAKMEKQLKYANAKQIPYVIVIGPEEAEKDMVTLKNMQTREQEQVSLETLREKLS